MQQCLVLDSLDPVIKRSLIRAGSIITTSSPEEGTDEKERVRIQIDLPPNCIYTIQSRYQSATRQGIMNLIILPSGDSFYHALDNEGSSSVLWPASVTIEETTLEQILSGLSDISLRNDRCSYCGTHHTRYFVEIKEEEGEDEILSIGWFLELFGSNEEGKRQLRQPCLQVGNALLDTSDREQFARIIDRTVEHPYLCEELMKQARLAYEKAMRQSDHAFVTKVKRVLVMLSDEYDWDAHWERDCAEDLGDMLKKCLVVEYVAGQSEEREDNRAPQKMCGSAEVENTPKALYRLLYLSRPENISFQDMYKSCLMILSSPDKRFSVAIHLYKYELALYYWAEAALVQEEQGGYALQVSTGVPSADNGASIQHEEGLLFFEMIRQALNTRWSVYPGNNFLV